MDYKEKLEKAKELYQTANADQKYVLESLFPELAESEDERIRKWLICGMNALKEKSETFATIPIDDAIAWLEKQGKTFTKKDIDDAYLKGVCDAKQELEKQGNKETLCDKCRKEQPSHSCQDITALGRCALEKQGEQNLANSAKTCKKSRRMISAEAKEALYDKSAPIDIDKMVDDYANNEEFGKPLNCMVRAYRQGLKDAIGKVVSESAWSEDKIASMS